MNFPRTPEARELLLDLMTEANARLRAIRDGFRDRIIQVENDYCYAERDGDEDSQTRLLEERDLLLDGRDVEVLGFVGSELAARIFNYVSAYRKDAILALIDETLDTILTPGETLDRLIASVREAVEGSLDYYPCDEIPDYEVAQAALDRLSEARMPHADGDDCCEEGCAES